MKSFYKIILLNFLIITLTACGFHLRGYVSLPTELHTLYLKTNSPYSAFTKQLIQTLNAAKVVIVDNRDAAPFTLQILSEGHSLQSTSTGASGQTTTYILNYSVVYQLLDKSGKVLQPPQTLMTSRSYIVTSSQLLGDTSTQNNLLVEMRREVIYQMLDHLRSPNSLQALTAQ